MTAFLGAAPGASAQYGVPYNYVQPTSVQSVSNALNDWRRLRQSSGYSFADYARFLIANPNWPDENRMRGWAEKAIQPGDNPATVIAFFTHDKPETGNGWARLADAYAVRGRAAEALAAARQAWTSTDLGSSDEQAIWSRYGASFTTADRDARVDSLLFDKDADDAARWLAYTSPERRAAFAARIAMQQNADNADALYGAAIGSVTSDAGLMMDRARYLRDHNYDDAAQQLAARTHHFTYRPADVGRFYEMLLILANDAASDRKWGTAYNIARQIDDALPPGTKVSEQPLDIRDNYTSLAWLGGTVALDRMNHPSGALVMFDHYAHGGQSLQVLTKGYYWAGRAALASNQLQRANAYFQAAGAYPELFYGQLALERLGRSVRAPAAVLPQYTTTATQRALFNSRRLVQAIRILGQQGRSEEQALFVRALAGAIDSNADRKLAVELGQETRRPDLPVWVARMARVHGEAFYVRQAYPSLPGSVAPGIWSLAHGIARQESSFDPYVISHAGARGLMQLMTPTAREQADKMGVGFDNNRLISDPKYNVMIGSAYFQRLLNYWDGSVPLAVASYNAGSGNVRKWINTYGDPRGQVDMLKWIEAIPYTETKGYVQRVIENSVVYDSLRPAPKQQTALSVSKYLGKSQPG